MTFFVFASVLKIQEFKIHKNTYICIWS